MGDVVGTSLVDVVGLLEDVAVSDVLFDVGAVEVVTAASVGGASLVAAGTDVVATTAARATVGVPLRGAVRAGVRFGTTRGAGARDSTAGAATTSPPAATSVVGAAGAPV